MTEEVPNNVMLGVGIDAYEHLEPLTRAVADVREVAARLEGFRVVTCFDGRREEIVDALEDAAPRDGLARPGTALVVLWAGHAERGTSGALRLFAVDNQKTDGDLKLITVDQLAQTVASSGARQILLILDTCYSGSGALDALAVVDAVQRGVADAEHLWVGIVASTRDYERAVDGDLAKQLIRLLKDGPRDERLRLRWSVYQAQLRGDDLLDALGKEWDGERQAPKKVESGDAWPFLPNPLYRPDAPEHVVEHLLWAARGGAQSEQGFWFTGREQPLRELVAWIGKGEPGLCVITGPPGCGKSAVAGRVVSLSVADERREIAGAQGLPPAELDPGKGSVDAHVQLRGVTLERLAEDLAGQLRVNGRHYQEVLGALTSRETPPLIVLDGLDEVGEARFEIAADFLAPLSRYARLVVATREVEGADTDPSLLDTLGVPALRLDLDENARDIHDYVVARLRGVDERMDPETVAEAIEGPFLLARILTSQLIAAPADTSDDAWRARLSSTIEEAFERDLEGDKRALDLLTALAYSYGPGFPAEDVWPAVASALSETEYGRLDAVWALAEYGRYITASSLGGQAVYRLHQRLTDTLLGSELDAVSRSVLSVYERHLDHGLAAVEHPYLWLYAWRHAVDGEEEGAEAMDALARRDGMLRPDAGLAWHALSARYSQRGRRLEAVDPSERAVLIYDQLADEDAAFLDALGNALNNLGVRYSEVGRHAEAIAPTERAAHIYEQLGKESPAFLNDLASALNNLGNRYSQVGRHAEAIAPTTRAVTIREQLAKETPAFLNDLAGALNNLGNRYRDVGRRADAVAPTERAVTIYEQLATDNPAFLNDLASALNNLGSRYSEVGRRAEAIAPTERAVTIREQLADENPAFLNDLASALNNLGVRYSHVGRRAEAIAPTERAVHIYEQLAKENPAFLNDLASALNNLGVRYSHVGRRGDAIAPTERAIVIREQLAKDNPAFLNDLAGALNNLGNHYSHVGRRADAIAPTERAVTIYEQLAKENPAFLNDLARALNNLGIRYSEVGRRAEAIVPTERAAHIYQQIAKENPAFLNDLAGALNNVGNRYGQVGRHAEATVLIERAVTIREQLAKDNPAFLNDLAMALNNLGSHYGDVGRRADAIAPTERAVAIREQLAKENPAFLNDLAMALTNLGSHYSQVGRQADAIAPTERAVTVREHLAKENPAFLNDLASALNNLGRHYGQAGRRAEAIAPTERAVTIREQLAKDNPAFLSELATALNNLAGLYEDEDRASRVWTDTLNRFTTNAYASAVLRVRRRRAPDELEEALSDLFEALVLDPGTDPHLTVEMHSRLRALRGAHIARFDEIWRGELPRWLTLDEAALTACVDWLNTESWSHSRDLLAGNEALLRDGETALGELALRYPNDPNIAAHRQLLAACKRDGIDAAFRPLLIQESFAIWRAIEDPDAARRFLDDHADLLLTPDAMALVDDPVGAARLTLVAEDAEGLTLDDARRAASPAVLEAVAVLALDADPARAVVHVAISFAVSGRSGEAREQLEQLPHDVDTAPLIVDLTDAITHRPEHAAELAGLIAALIPHPQG